MIYQMKLVIRDEERDITDFIYHCHISHYNDPDLDKMIELHIKVCEEIGNREDLPIEGDLIALTFNSTNHDQFFYDWLFEGAMQDGEIQFIYNEVETADIFRFWDCYCLGLEESMSVGGAPMRITIYLSPGIIKRNNLAAREKVWKVSSPSTDKKPVDNKNTQEAKKKTSKENATFASKGRETIENNSPISTVIAVIHIKPPFILKKKFQNEYYESEMKKQLKMQEDGINKLTIYEWLKNRENYLEHGRDKSSNNAQQDARERYRQERIEELCLLNPDKEEVEISKMVENELNTLAALHNPDQIAGGYADNVSEMGNARINYSIGKQWGTKKQGRAKNLEKDVQKIVDGPPPMTEEEQKRTKMNVCLTKELLIQN